MLAKPENRGRGLNDYQIAALAARAHLSHFVQCYDLSLARSAPDTGASELNR
jgi:hypothetical protein